MGKVNPTLVIRSVKGLIYTLQSSAQRPDEVSAGSGLKNMDRVCKREIFA